MAIIARYRDLPAAEVASATLEAAGLTNTLFDDATIGVNWAYSTALGWVKVYVAEADAAEARELLEPPREIEWPAEVTDLPAGERCPFCGSEDLALESGPRKTFAVWTTLNVPLWIWRSRLRCRACGEARRVPLRFRPELVAAGLAIGFVLTAVIALLMLVGAYLVHTLREISR